ncbi:hypothetical protein NL676_020265 [Syzygium grande]|nr:hypothetical protein NL676_020265 [Syzygium grande]
MRTLWNQANTVLTVMASANETVIIRSKVSCPPSVLATAPEPPPHAAAIDFGPPPLPPLSAASVFPCVARTNNGGFKT